MIRQATLVDLDNVLLVEKAGFPDKDAYNRRQFQRLLTPSAPGVVLVEEDAGELWGLVALCWRKGSTVGNIYDLVVRPQRRRSGLGGKLLAAAEAIARELGLKVLSVEVRSANIPARTLYENVGFTYYKRLKDYYGRGEYGLRLRKTL